MATSAVLCLSQLVVGCAAEPAPLEAVYPHAYGAFPQDLLSAGISNLGRSFRTKHLLTRLRAGQPVTILMLGAFIPPPPGIPTATC